MIRAGAAEPGPVRQQPHSNHLPQPRVSVSQPLSGQDAALQAPSPRGTGPLAGAEPVHSATGATGSALNPSQAGKGLSCSPTATFLGGDLTPHLLNRSNKTFLLALPAPSCSVLQLPPTLAPSPNLWKGGSLEFPTSVYCPSGWEAEAQSEPW